MWLMWLSPLAWIGIGMSLFGIGLSLLLTLHGLWQLDIICVDPVWSTNQFINWFVGTGYETYSNIPFQCGLWKTTIGRAYDVYLSLPVVGWFVLLMSMCLFTVSIVFLVRKYYLFKSESMLTLLYRGRILRSEDVTVK